MIDLSAPAVVGLDLSLTASGVSVIYPDGTIDVQTVSSKGAGTPSLSNRGLRLSRIVDRIALVPPVGAKIAVETPAYNQTSGHHHDRSGLWWMVVERLLEEHEVYEVSTTQVKKYATGKGNASKMEVMAAAIKRYPDADIANDNEADAVILAAYLRRALGHPADPTLPKANISALDKFKI